MNFLSTKWNYGFDFQTHSKLEESEMIAEFRGILVGLHIPPSWIEPVNHAKSMRGGFLFWRQIAIVPNAPGFRFCTDSDDYRPNWTTRITITIT